MISPLSASATLRLWENGYRRRPADRALLMAVAADPHPASAELQAADEAIDATSLGQRNARLLALRIRTLGPLAECRSNCPECGAELEFQLDLSRWTSEGDSAGSNTLEFQGYHVTYRLLANHDLAAVAGQPDLASARQALIARCVLQASQAGADLARTSLPEPLVSALGEAILERDPLADPQLALTCPACGHAWSASFDIASFLWSELDVAARRLVAEVHAIAHAYGWREAEILALSPLRRQAYLELLG